MATSTRIRPRTLVRASGGSRCAVAPAVDALGTGLLRPFLLLHGVPGAGPSGHGPLSQA